MPSLGAPELIIILVIIVLIFGVGKLPEVGSALGKGIREFRSASDDLDKKDEPADTPAAAVEPPRQPPAVAAPAAPETVAYIVRSGDTLDSIAQSHGVRVEALMQANGYGQRDRVLYAGDRVLIPQGTARAT